MWHLILLGLLLGADAPNARPAASPAAETVARPADGKREGPSINRTRRQEKDKDKVKQQGGAPAKAESAEETAAEESAGGGPAGIDYRKVLEDILDSGAIGELRRGGVFMWPILVLGIVAAGVVIERWRSLKMLSTDTAALRDEVTRMLQTDRVEEALAKCDAQQGPVPAVLAVGLRKFLVLRRLNYDPGRIEEQVVKSMDDYGVHIVAALERHLPILATVASAAPMLGFLGTVQGMVISFREIVERMGETNIVEAAARGINIALLTTVFGLIVGIPAYIAYNYFTSVINRYVLDVEESATELIETVTLQMALQSRGDESIPPTP